MLAKMALGRPLAWIALTSALLSACGLALEGALPKTTPDAGEDGGEDIEASLPPPTIVDSAVDVITDAPLESCTTIDACVPEVVLALDAGDVRALAVTPSFIYFTSLASQTIERMEHDGKNRVVLLSGVAAHTIHVSDEFLYWVKVGGALPGLHRMIPDGGSDKLLFANVLGCIFPMGDDVIVGDLNTSRVLSIAPDGGARVLATAAQGAAQPYGVVASANDLFFTYSGAGLEDGGIYRLSNNAILAVPIATQQRNPNCMEIEGPNTIYWANYLEGAIRKSAFDGGGNVAIATGLTTPVSIVATPSAFFYNSGGAVIRLPR